VQGELSDADRSILERAWLRAVRLVRPEKIGPMQAWLTESAPDPLRHLFYELPKVRPVGQSLDIANDLVEQHLASNRPASRKARGAWFTPLEVAFYLVGRAEVHLRESLHHPEGWLTGDDDPGFVIWDPAIGTGAFQLALLVDAGNHWMRVGPSGRPARKRPEGSWSAFVNRCLLPRMRGCEIEPLSLAVACMRVAEELAMSGYDFVEPLELPWRLGDAFDERKAIYPDGTLVVIGNPPYGSLSRPTDGWIEGLIRGDQWPQHASYRHANGQPARERKSWLHDDYVKFFRLAQWQVEHAKNGVMAFVTNHGFLDNAGFRGMREALTTTFDRIEILDLHGNTNKKETAQDGERDENVFAITTGVALSVLTRTGKNLQGSISIGDLRGPAKSKREQLEAAAYDRRSLSPTKIDLSATQFRFTSERTSPPPRWYQYGVRITDLMPVSTTAPVTARDYFVVDIDRAALEGRLESFADLSKPDEEIRAAWFQRTRSPRYATGDTRGWKLSEARRRFAADPNWRQCIRPVQYRPLDERWIAWHKELIDWPRSQVVKHFLDRPNIVLIARRQGLPDQPYTFFWVTDKLTLDGILRSDNKGSESLFPLWLYDEEGNARPNISAAVLESWERRLWEFSFSGPTKNYRSSRFSEKSIAGWLYAWFFSATYRSEAIDALRMDFPRIPIPKSGDIFLEFSELGWELLTLHMETATLPRYPVPNGPVNNPVWQNGNVVLDRNIPQTAIAETSELVWNFRIGSHQPARKWIVERRGISWTAESHGAYERLIRLLTETLDVETAIERLIARHGGISGCCAES
jgi:hypothetical protein